MILRVYTMWNRSRTILFVLLFVYVAQTILSIVIAGIYINPDTYLSGMSQAELVVSTQSQANGPTFPVSLFSSHDRPNSGFLALQRLLEHPDGRHTIFYNSSISSRYYVVDSRSR